MEDNNDYQKALETAHAEMTALLVQHAALEKRIAKLRQIISTLASLTELTDNDEEPSQLERASSARFGEVTGSDMALSDAVREVLKASGEPMTALQVRRGLRRMGIDPDQKYTSPLSVIHTALRRLKEKGEAKPGKTEEGGTTYQWVGQRQLLTRRQRRLAESKEFKDAPTLPPPTRRIKKDE